MRGLKLFLPACVLLALAASPAYAVIDNTHHDMNTFLNGSFTCYACHGYRQGLAADNNLGTVGSFCYNQCHRGAGGIAGAILLASDYPNTGNENGALWAGGNTRVARGPVYSGGTATTVMKYANGHGRSWGLMPSTDNDATDRNTRTSGWPHLGSGDMECTGCHDVHNNTYAPFLRKPLSVGVGGNIDPDAIGASPGTFCVACHTGSSTSGAGRWNVVTANANGAHPIETPTGAATRSGGTPARHGRWINIKGTVGASRNDANDNSSVFKAFSLYQPGTGASGLGLNTNHYRPGGKTGNFAAPDNTVICITCHGIHLPGNYAGTNNLTYVSIGDKAAATELNNPICVACHGPGPTPTGTSNANPGVSNYYHPVNAEALSTGGTLPDLQYQASTGSFTFVVNVGGGTDLGLNNRLVCTSCHSYGHGGAPGTMLMTTRSNGCNGCHNTTTVQLGNTPNSHHRYGGGINYQSAANGGYSNPSYASGAMGDLSNGLGCEDCHVFNGTAHNW